MKRTAEELIGAVQALAGDRTDDTVISLLEDISDSFTVEETAEETETEDWKAKYDELDKMWREKYIARFSEGKATETQEEETQEEEEVDKLVSIEDLDI